MALFGRKNVIRKNSTGDEFIARRENLNAGTGIDLTVTADPANGETDITIAATTPTAPTAPSSVGLSASSATPTAPSGLTVGSATATTLTANWTDNSNNESRFELQYDTDSDVSSPIATLNVA